MRFFRHTIHMIYFVALAALYASVPGAAHADDIAQWEYVDGIVATIGGSPVLRSDIHMEADFGLLEANGEANGSGDAFEGLKDVYLNRMLILREIEELGGYRLNSGEAEGAYRGYLGQFSDRIDFDDKLARWGVDEVEIFRRLKNALLTTLYTESRLQFLVNVLPSEIEEAYRKNPQRWGGRGLYESWETIRADLIRETFASEKGIWLGTLKERYELILY